MVADAEGRYGPHGCVVANAGIAYRVPLPELTDERWDHTHEIYLKGVMRVCRAAAPAAGCQPSSQVSKVSEISSPDAPDRRSSVRRSLALRPSRWLA